MNITFAPGDVIDVRSHKVVITNQQGDSEVVHKPGYSNVMIDHIVLTNDGPRIFLRGIGKAWLDGDYVKPEYCELVKAVR